MFTGSGLCRNNDALYGMRKRVLFRPHHQINKI